MASIGEALLIAFDHHRSGRLAEAETLYRRILEADREQPDALHLLGILYGQAGRPDEARRFVGSAIALSPANPDYPFNLANTLRTNGRAVEAKSLYGWAAALQPLNGEAVARLAAIEARQGTEPEKAQARGRVAAVLKGGAGAEALYEFAIAALEADWTAEAESLLVQAVALAPDSAVSHANLALLLHRRGETEGAGRHYRMALVLRPAFAEMLGGLASLAFERRGADPTALAVAASLSFRAGRLAPLDRDAAIRLSVALIGLGREGEVGAVLAPHLAADPADLLVLFNLAQAGQNRDDGGEALGCYRRILTLDPALADVLQGIGRLLAGFGFAREGLRWQERALALVPSRGDWLRQLLMTVLYVSEIDPERRFALHRRLEALSPPAAPAVHTNRRDPERRLRIGYLTSDLRALQPVSRNMLPLYREHDRGRFAIHTYADIAEPDATTRRFQELSDGWSDLRGLDDAAVAERIRADGIDVLVLLAARFDRNRPLVCQERPAPVQIGLHDAGTSGLSTLDGLVTDRTMTPRHTTERFTERPLRLPSFYVADIPADAPPVGSLPMMGDGIVRFGCFNNPAKISDETLRLWAKAMGLVPQSRLFLKYTQRYRNPVILDRIRDGLAAGGIAAERIEAAWDRVDTMADHLAGYNRIDIALDPFPFTGSTTTFEALSMGVPVVTLAQDVMVGRWSASMLRAVGLGDLAASTEQQYLDAVARLCSDPAALSALRAGLRGRLSASPLCDGRRRTRQIERFYRALWRRWCRRPA